MKSLEVATVYDPEKIERDFISKFLPEYQVYINSIFYGFDEEPEDDSGCTDLKKAMVAASKNSSIFLLNLEYNGLHEYLPIWLHYATTGGEGSFFNFQSILSKWAESYTSGRGEWVLSPEETFMVLSNGGVGDLRVNFSLVKSISSMGSPNFYFADEVDTISFFRKNSGDFLHLLEWLGEVNRIGEANRDMDYLKVKKKCLEIQSNAEYNDTISTLLETYLRHKFISSDLSEDEKSKARKAISKNLIPFENDDLNLPISALLISSIFDKAKEGALKDNSSVPLEWYFNMTGSSLLKQTERYSREIEEAWKKALLGFPNG